MAIELIGVNVGGTTTSVVRGSEHGRIYQRLAFPTNASRDAEALYREIVDAVQGLQNASTAGIGVAIGGPLDFKRGTILMTPHLPFVDFPLRDRLARDCRTPVCVHHDAAACALAEWRWGPDAGKSGVAYLTCGTGFGVGLVLDGRVRYGSNGHSPEIGHVRYRDDGPDIFGKRGCFEGFGSAKALGLMARERDPLRYAAVEPREIAERSRAGDPEAAELVAENARAVGAACALLADLLVVDVVVLGSLATYLGDDWIAAVRSVFEREALPSNSAHCRLRAPIPDVQDLSGLAAGVDAVLEAAG